MGNGENGKSVLLKLYGNLLGKTNISHYSLQEMAEDKFAAAGLYGKLANICADIPNQTVKYSGIFKRITSGDPMTLQRKYGQPFESELFARLIFSANEVPRSWDVTYAYTRRWTLLPFPNTFSKGQRDENLISKLSTSDETSGFLARCVRSYIRMLRRQSFASGDSAARAKERFREDLDHVLTFIREETYSGENVEIGQTLLYREYKRWIEDQEIKPVSARSFNSRLSQHLPDLAKKTVVGIPTWSGVGLLVKGD